VSDRISKNAINEMNVKLSFSKFLLLRRACEKWRSTLLKLDHGFLDIKLVGKGYPNYQVENGAV
jgi:hypothetical protein